jgi:hypothetical protein
MDFRDAMREVDREDGFWAHLIRLDGRAFSWKRFEEAAGGGWGPTVLEEGERNAYALNPFVPPKFPWVVWIARGAPDDFRIGGGSAHFILARFLGREGRLFAWRRVEPAPHGQFKDIGEIIESNAYETNDWNPPRFPWITSMRPRSIPGEFLFSVT